MFRNKIRGGVIIAGAGLLIIAASFEVYRLAYASPSCPVGSSCGAIQVDTNTNNVSFGNVTADPQTSLLIGSSSSVQYALRIASSTGNLFYVDNTGTVWMNGVMNGGVVGAANISSGQFGSNPGVGGGNFSFPASVGIGTTNFSSGYPLIIAGSANAQLSLSASGSGGLAWNILSSDSGNSAGAGKLIFLKSTDSSSNGRMTIDSSGNVGIGTTNPVSKLDVAAGSQLAVDNIAAHSGSGMILNAPGTTGGLVYQLQYNNAAKLVMDTNGNVGIGTTTPAYPLTVAGDINFTGTLRQNGTPFSSGTSQWTTTGTMIYYNGGNVGIGMTNPGARLHITYASANSGATTPVLILDNPSGGGQTAMSFRVNGVAEANIRGDSSGNIVISPGNSSSNNTYIGWPDLGSTGYVYFRSGSNYFDTSNNLAIGGNYLYTNGSAGSYGAISISGSKNGYSGINFPGSGTLMMNSSYSGFFNAADTGWRFYVDNSGNAVVPGNLTVNGSITSNSSGAARQSEFAGCQPQSSGAICYITGNWSSGGFADANYTAACQGVGNSYSRNTTMWIQSKSASQIQVGIQSVSGQAGYGTIDCVGVHW